jgi:hypothetical protein
LVCFCLCLFCVVDLPCYMTTGVNVDFILNCFFTCKDRALERDRPYQRKKKSWRRVDAWLSMHNPGVWQTLVRISKTWPSAN